jgi:hypothetical protein
MPNDPTPTEPVHLVEDPDTGDRFLIYGTDRGLRVELRYVGDALWMTQAQIAALFGVDRSVVTKHIANVYADGELDPDSTCAKIAQVRLEAQQDQPGRIFGSVLPAMPACGRSTYGPAA